MKAYLLDLNGRFFMEQSQERTDIKVALAWYPDEAAGWQNHNGLLASFDSCDQTKLKHLTDLQYITNIWKTTQEWLEDAFLTAMHIWTYLIYTTSIPSHSVCFGTLGSHHPRLLNTTSCPTWSGALYGPQRMESCRGWNPANGFEIQWLWVKTCKTKGTVQFLDFWMKLMSNLILQGVVPMWSQRLMKAHQCLPTPLEWVE